MSPNVPPKAKFSDVILEGGETRIYSSLGIDGTDRTYEIADIITISSDTTIPGNASIVMKKGGSFDIAGGKTLTINGFFRSGAFRVFSGGGSVVFGDGSILSAHPEWWAENTTPGVTNMASAINAALAASLHVQLLKSNYHVGATTISITRLGATLRGVSKRGTIISATAAPAGGAIHVNGEAVGAYRLFGALSDFAITGTGEVGLHASEVANFTADRIYIYGFTTNLKSAGALIWTSDGLTVEGGVTGIDLSTGAVIPSPSNMIRFRNGEIINNSKYAIKCVQGASILFDGYEIEGNGTAAQAENVCDFTDMGTIGLVPAVTFRDSWFEGNKSAAAELYFRGHTRDSGIRLDGTPFYSTDVNYNVDIDDAKVDFSAVGMGAVVGAYNAIFGSNAWGFWGAASYANISNASVGMVISQWYGEVQIKNGAFDGGHIVLGAYHLWIDAAGRLRIKSSAPTTEADGTIVGTQS